MPLHHRRIPQRKLEFCPENNYNLINQSSHLDGPPRGRIRRCGSTLMDTCQSLIGQYYLYLLRAPIAEGEREDTHCGHQSQKGRENIPISGTNRRRGENIPIAGTNLHGDHGGNLDDGVLVRLGKASLAAGALDVKREDAQLSEALELAFARVAHQLLAPAHHLNQLVWQIGNRIGP
eukprot:1178889-Prorocentrum_minimum.AAC.5